MYKGVLLMKQNKEPLFARAAWRAEAVRGAKRDDHAAVLPAKAMTCRDKGGVVSLHENSSKAVNG